MNPGIVSTVITLSSLGVVASVILYIVASKFKVHEDPRIDLVDEELPGANCGGCGYPGCRSFAEACVKADALDNYFCPVGGNDLMAKVAKILGKEIAEKDPEVAVLLCNGHFDVRKRTNQYDGPSSCSLSNMLYMGETGCQYGCLGQGDCVEACDFEAMYMDEKTGLPVIIDDKCIACGACVKACPRDIIELRKRGKKEKKIYVSCINKDKGAPAKRACSVACIGCGKCVKVCPFDAITLENNLAYIDSHKCKLCRKCVIECPTNSILEFNFPPRKPKPEKTGVEKSEKTGENTGKSTGTKSESINKEINNNSDKSVS